MRSSVAAVRHRQKKKINVNAWETIYSLLRSQRFTARQKRKTLNRPSIPPIDKAMSERTGCDIYSRPNKKMKTKFNQHMRVVSFNCFN